MIKEGYVHTVIATTKRAIIMINFKTIFDHISIILVQMIAPLAMSILREQLNPQNYGISVQIIGMYEASCK